MNKIRRPSIRLSMVALVLIGAFPALALLFVLSLEKRQNAGIQAQQEMLYLARMITAEQEQNITSAQQMLVALSETPNITKLDQCSQYLTRLRSHLRQFENLSVVAPDGTLVCSAVPYSGTPDYSGEDWLHRAVDTGSFTPGGYQVNPVTGKGALMLAHPVTDTTGHVEMVLVAALDLQWIGTMASQAALPDGASLWLVDSRGVIIANYPTSQGGAGQVMPNPDLLAAVKAQPEGTLEANGADGEPRLYAYYSYRSKQMAGKISLIVAVPAAAAYSRANHEATISLIYLGVVTFLVMVAAWWVGYLLFGRRALQILKTTQRLAAGDFSARTGLQHDAEEVGQVAHAIDTLAEKLQTQKIETERHLKALQDSEERYRRLTENARDVIFRIQISPRWEFEYVSPAAEQVTGYTVKEHYANPELAVEIVLPEDLEKLQEAFMQTPPCSQPLTLRWKRKDGQVIWVEQRMMPIYDDQGKLVAVEGIVRDISDRISAERLLERQLAELDVLHTIALAGADLTSQDELITRATQVVSNRLYPHNFGVILLNETTGMLEPHPSYQAHSPATPPRPQPVGQGVIGLAVQNMRPYRVNMSGGGFFAAQSEAQSQLCVPIISAAGAIGALYTESSEILFYREADERLLVTLADELGTALEKLRLRQSAARRSQELAALAMISAALRAAPNHAVILPMILEQALELFQASGAMISMPDPVTGELVTKAAVGGWSGDAGQCALSLEEIHQQVFTTRQPIITTLHAQENHPNNNLAVEGIRALVCLPMIANEQVVGVICLGRAQAISEEEVRLFSAIADISANAIYRDTLFEETESRSQMLTSVRAIDQAITTNVDINETLDVLLGHVIKVLRVEAAAVMLYNHEDRSVQWAAGRGFEDEPCSQFTFNLSAFHEVTLETPPPARALLRRQLVFIPNIHELPPAILPQKGGVHSFASACFVPLIAQDAIQGLLAVFDRTPLNPDRGWFTYLESLAGQAALALHSASLSQRLRQSNRALALAYDRTIEGWVHALDLRDKETEGHTQRVVDLTLRIARRMNFSLEQLVHIRRGALLHDIGKIGITDKVLLKPGPLNEEELQIMRRHPVYAYEMLSPIEFLNPALQIPYCHHEWWNGKGYPRGLAGEEIPLEARIFAVVDVWDALRSNRPYRMGWPEGQVFEYIRRQSGKQFDPAVVETFFRVLREEARSLPHPHGTKPLAVLN